MILVTGATGNVGRPLIDLLRADGAPVRAVTRREHAGLPSGVETVCGDPSRPETIAAALDGVTSLFLNPAAIGDGVGDLLALAREHKVTRVVLLSSMTVRDDLDEQRNSIAARHKAIEDALTACGLEWAILRGGAFATNTIGWWSAQIRAGDVVRGGYARASSAPVHERDLAAVAARALLTGDLLGARPVLTGPSSITYEEMVAAIGAAIGRPLRYVEVTGEEALRPMLASGLTEPVARDLLRLQSRSVGREAFITGEVEKILGRPALTYAEWARDHAEDFTAR